MTELLWKSAIELREMIGRREVSSVEVVEASLRRQADVEPHINAFVEVTSHMALESAKRADGELLAGRPPGRLHGLPLSVKDLISVEGVRLTFGSRAMADNVGGVDAPAVRRARDAGAAIIGKTTTSEFGAKGVGDSPLTGITRNPWDLRKTPGGSSAGAAASVAAGVTPFALGTDGGGSIRIPSSMTGLVGIKGQFGRVPVFPVSATPTLAHVGPIARTVRDAALLLEVVSGFDPRDGAAVAEPVPGFLAACERSPRGLRIAWSPTLGYAEPEPEVVDACEKAVQTLAGLGCEVELVNSVLADPLDLFLAEFYAGAGTRLRPVLDRDRRLLDPAVAQALDRALAQTLDEYYTKVFQRYDLRSALADFFESFDLLITPTLPVVAFDAGLDQPPGFADMFSWICYTYPFNLTGLPAASIPCGRTGEGLPIGMQIVSRHLRETDVFRVAAALEAERPQDHAKPPLP